MNEKDNDNVSILKKVFCRDINKVNTHITEVAYFGQ